MKKLANFLFEANALKRVKRTGWQILGVKDESVAEHIYVSCLIGFVLAKLAKIDENRVLKILLFHDLHEARTGDLNKISALYLKRDHRKAEKDSFEKLFFGKEVLNLLEEYQEQKTLEAKVAMDANILSLLVQLKEFVDQGNKQAKVWLKANGTRLRTKEGKNLFAGLKKTEFQDWWKNLRKKILKNYLKTK